MKTMSEIEINEKEKTCLVMRQESYKWTMNRGHWVCNYSKLCSCNKIYLEI